MRKSEAALLYLVSDKYKTTMENGRMGTKLKIESIRKFLKKEIKQRT
jgi:hypothetical protein